MNASFSFGMLLNTVTIRQLYDNGKRLFDRSFNLIVVYVNPLAFLAFPLSFPLLLGRIRDSKWKDNQTGIVIPKKYLPKQENGIEVASRNHHFISASL